MGHGVFFLAFGFGKRVARPCPANLLQAAIEQCRLHGPLEKAKRFNL
jgi:hypothetical protein